MGKSFFTSSMLVILGFNTCNGINIFFSSGFETISWITMHSSGQEENLCEIKVIKRPITSLFIVAFTNPSENWPFVGPSWGEGGGTNEAWIRRRVKGRGEENEGRPQKGWLSLARLLLVLLVLPGLFTWAFTPLGITLPGRRRRQRQSPSHCGFCWFCFKLEKSPSLFSPWSQSATSRWGGSSSCHFSSSPQAFWLLSFKGKIRWCNCVSVTAQSSSLNEIDERSGSRCYHKVP